MLLWYCCIRLAVHPYTTSQVHTDNHLKTFHAIRLAVLKTLILNKQK